jgi:alpha-aminoadipic semialdehyde synthase
MLFTPTRFIPHTPQQLRFTRSLANLGIRREGKNRWERRVAITPKDVGKLVKMGAKVIVQPSSKRIFGEELYREYGAEINESLEHADVVLGVKEVDIQDLLEGKTYCFFSHTHKAQANNMAMLANILDKRIRLVDYELLTDDAGKRLVLFGTFAGYAGMVDCLHGLGEKLLAIGYGTPFLHIGMTHQYRSLFDARASLRLIALHLSHEPLPKHLSPFVFVFTGNGHVSQGAQDVFKELPHEMMTIEEVREMIHSKKWDGRKVYGCQVTAKDYARRADGGFDYTEFRAKPELYHSVFAQEIAPYTTVLVNGIYWDRKFPRLLTQQDLERLGRDRKLMCIADISCDIEGSIEFMTHASTIDHPFYYYDALIGHHTNIEKPGLQICSIDNLPTELPLEASEYFSANLFPYVEAMLKGEWTNPVVSRAIIAQGGLLVGKHAKLKPFVDQVKKGKRVLVIGSGMVSNPVISILSKHYPITVATNQVTFREANERVEVVKVDVEKDDMTELIKQSDLVVSLVPAWMHPKIAQKCIELKKDMITASYRSPEMRNLDEEATRNGVIIMNEIGLDPGLDHLSAQKMIDEAESLGGTIVGFESFCGGLPAPECSDNPFGYKFSWSPISALSAMSNPALYMQDGEIKEIKGEDLLKSERRLSIWPALAFEVIPNRDSLMYKDIYGLKDVQTMFRGTLRYAGFCKVLDGFRELGFLSNDAVEPTWKAQLAKMKESFRYSDNEEVIHAIEWLNLTGDTCGQTVFQAFAHVLSQALSYSPSEKDLVLMHHIFTVSFPDRREEWKSSLIVYGGQESAMARTVGIPVALTALEILNGGIAEKGVLIPNRYHAKLLPTLERHGILFRESKRIVRN